MSDDDLEQELPEWTFQGGHFRSGFGSKDVPGKWYRKKGRWQRDEIVPFGKATPDYRERFYRCPECEYGLLTPEQELRIFNCTGCSMQFSTFFGSLTERPDENRYTPEDV